MEKGEGCGVCNQHIGFYPFLFTLPKLNREKVRDGGQGKSPLHHPSPFPLLPSQFLKGDHHGNEN
jgi:hypothetical protein